MSGWHRLFVAVCVMAGALYALVWMQSRPTAQWANNVYTCKLNEYEVSPSRAKMYLKSGKIPALDNHQYPEQDVFLTSECWEDLKQVASGRRHEILVGEWRVEAIKNLRWLFAFLASIYGIAWGIGWVWRGFFPKKQPAP